MSNVTSNSPAAPVVHNGEMIANGVPFGGSAKKYVATIHTDPDGVILDHFLSVMEELHDEASVQWAWVGPPEQSGESENRQSLVPDAYVQMHYHAIVHFSNRVGTRWLKDNVWVRMIGHNGGNQYPQGGVFWMIQRGTDEQAIAYASKSGGAPVLNVGASRSNASKQGVHTELESFKTAVRDGVVSCADDAMELHSVVFAKYSDFVFRYLAKHAVPRPELPADYQLRYWQAMLIEQLQTDPDDRTVIFQVDPVGNSGKSWFCRFVHALLPDRHVQVIRPEKNRDMAMIIDERADVILVDVPREVTMDEDKKILNYRILEEIKDGYVSSAKYSSRTKWMKPCHVVVFMNHPPHSRALSADRYVIIDMVPEFNRVVSPRPDPVVSNFGPEFQGDNAGDGPTFDAAKYAELMKPKGEVVYHQTTIAATQRREIVNSKTYLPYQSAGYRFWSYGEPNISISTSKAFLVRVVKGDSRGLDEWCARHLKWDGSGVIDLHIDLGLWPKQSMVFWDKEQYLDTEKVGYPYLDYEGNYYILLEVFNQPHGEYATPGDSRMVFGNDHALQVEHGNFQGNPFKAGPWEVLGGDVVGTSPPFRVVPKPVEDPSKLDVIYRKFVMNIRPKNLLQFWTFNDGTVHVHGPTVTFENLKENKVVVD